MEEDIMSKVYFDKSALLEKAFKEFCADYNLEKDDILELRHGDKIKYAYIGCMDMGFLSLMRHDDNGSWLFDPDLLPELLHGYYEITNTHRKHIMPEWMCKMKPFIFKPDWDI